MVHSGGLWLDVARETYQVQRSPSSGAHLAMLGGARYCYASCWRSRCHAYLSDMNRHWHGHLKLAGRA